MYSCYVFLLAALLPLAAGSGLRVTGQWRQIEYEFPSENERQSALANGTYILGNSVPLDVDVYYGKDGTRRVFMTVPKLSPGVPASLGEVRASGALAPYPDYSWHKNPGQNCDYIVSVFRIFIDECGRLWVMDTGGSLCPPQLLAFDLATDTLLYRHRLPAANVDPASLYVTPVVDVRDGPDKCTDTFVYVADVGSYSLLVVDVRNDRSWTFRHPAFYPFPDQSRFTIEGLSFTFMDGILGLALTPLTRDNERHLLFHSLASVTENAVATSVLRDVNATGNFFNDLNVVTTFRGRRGSQAAAQAMDDRGVLYFGLVWPPSVQCWNSATPYGPRDIHPLAVDAERLQFASGVKVVRNAAGRQELWVITNRLQRLLNGVLTNQTVNFRIHSASTDALLAHSPCGYYYW